MNFRPVALAALLLTGSAFAVSAQDPTPPDAAARVDSAPASPVAEPGNPVIFMRSELKIRIAEIKATPKTGTSKGSPGMAAHDVKFQVEIQTPAQIAGEGIFLNADLAAGTGILILYDAPQKAAYPLSNVTGTFDLLFVEGTGAVSEVFPSVEGGSAAAVASTADDILAMVQLPAGTCEREGIKPGDMAVSKYFSPKLKKIVATPQS